MPYLSNGLPLKDGSVLCRGCNLVAENVLIAIQCGWTEMGVKIEPPKDSHFYWANCPEHSRILTGGQGVW